MTIDELEDGLRYRGFIGIEGMEYMGKCHKDEQHYILLTDGVVTYSTIPFWRNKEYAPDATVKHWNQNPWNEEIIPGSLNQFTWKEFDSVIASVFHENQTLKGIPCSPREMGILAKS